MSQSDPGLPSNTVPTAWRPRLWRSRRVASGDVREAPRSDDDGSAASIAAVEAALQRKGWRLGFPKAIEEAYHRETGVARLTRIVLCNVIGALMTLANTVRDSSMMPTLDPLLSPLRWGTATFIIVAAALMYWRRDTLSAWLRETVTSAGSVLIAIYVLIAAHGPIDDISVLIRMGGAFLIFMHAGLAARQQFGYTLGQGLFILLGYALAARSHSEEQAAVVSGNLLLLATTFSFSLVANYVLEFRERHAYLLRKLEAHQRGQLAETTWALRKLSLTDGLTALANRRHFEAELQARWQAATPDAPLALLQLDVDFFKRYNDHHGHPAGDVCLRKIAGVLSSVAAAQGGLAARTGGEEFALLLPAHTLAAAAAVGETFRRAVRALALPHGDSAAAPIVTVSIGAAAGEPSAAYGTRELIHSADRALYAAKHAGRDRVECEVPAPAVARPVEAGADQAQAAVPAASEPTTIPQQPQASSALSERLADLNGELQHNRLRRLRFAPAMEKAFVLANQEHRAALLTMTGVFGALTGFAYMWLSRSLFADVAERVAHGFVWITAAQLVVAVSLRSRMTAGMREVLYAASAVGLATAAIFLVAPSQKITVYTYALSLFLVPTFAAVVAAQPFRMSLLISIIAWAAMLIGLRPDDESAHAVWIESSLLVFDGIAFALVGGYLLELSTRRNYLLKELAASQRELLGRHTQELRGLAATDPLTALANRRSFDERHAALWASCAAEGRPLSLLIIDIDHFKRYNDSLGHPAGDRCLRRVAQALEPLAAREDRSTAAPLVARLGGEEFGVLLPDHDLPSALAFAQRLCTRVSELRIEHPDSPTAPWVTVSIGAAVARPLPGTTAGALLHDADAALYQAKALGRDRAQAFVKPLA